MVLNRLPVRLQVIRKFTVQARPFTVLALESSADDTCAAVVDSSRKILSNIVVKQHDLYVIQSHRFFAKLCDVSLLDRHERFGGIHPMVAIEAHQRNMVATMLHAT
jgi:Metal-dependent proteases with possible chaperone activity